MSHLLELLGLGLEHDLSDLLDRYFWSPPSPGLPGRIPPQADTSQLEARCREHPGRADPHLPLGLACLRAGQWDGAIEHLRRACAQNPQDVPALLAMAAACDGRGDSAGALEHLENALRHDGGAGHPAPIFFAVGLCQEKLQRPREAADHYRRAAAEDKDFVAAHERLAAVNVVAGDIEGAIGACESLRTALPGQAWVRATLGHLYFRAGRHSRAIEEFQAAIALEPENWSMVDEEVESMIAGGQVRQAMQRLNELLDQQGPFADLHVRLGDLHGQVGDDEQALRHYHQALELQENYLEATVKVGTHHLVFGRWDQAAEAFAQAAAINDSLMANYVGLGAAQDAAGQGEEAARSFELAAAIEPNSTLLLAEASRLHVRSSAAQAPGTATAPARPSTALKAGEEAPSRPAYDPAVHSDVEGLTIALERYARTVEEHPGRADLRYQFAVLLRADGQDPQAAEQFVKVLGENPCCIEARIRLGILQAEGGRKDQAAQTFRQALQTPPEALEAHYRLGVLYTDRRRLEEEARRMEAAAGPADRPRVRERLALSLQNLGLMDRAAAVWRSAWRVAPARQENQPSS